MKKIYELNAEIFKNKVYVEVDALVRLCEGSVSKNNTPFDHALKLLAIQLKDIENEAKVNLGVNNAINISTSTTVS